MIPSEEQIKQAIQKEEQKLASLKIQIEKISTATETNIKDIIESLDALSTEKLGIITEIHDLTKEKTLLETEKEKLLAKIAEDETNINAFPSINNKIIRLDEIIKMRQKFLFESSNPTREDVKDLQENLKLLEENLFTNMANELNAETLSKDFLGKLWSTLIEKHEAYCLKNIITPQDLLTKQNRIKDYINALNKIQQDLTSLTTKKENLDSQRTTLLSLTENATLNIKKIKETLINYLKAQELECTNKIQTLSHEIGLIDTPKVSVQIPIHQNTKVTGVEKTATSDVHLLPTISVLPNIAPVPNPSTKIPSTHPKPTPIKQSVAKSFTEHDFNIKYLERARKAKWKTTNPYKPLTTNDKAKQVKENYQALVTRFKTHLDKESQKKSGTLTAEQAEQKKAIKAEKHHGQLGYEQRTTQQIIADDQMRREIRQNMHHNIDPEGNLQVTKSVTSEQGQSIQYSATSKLDEDRNTISFTFAHPVLNHALTEQVVEHVAEYARATRGTLLISGCAQNLRAALELYIYSTVSNIPDNNGNPNFKINFANDGTEDLILKAIDMSNEDLKSNLAGQGLTPNDDDIFKYREILEGIKNKHKLRSSHSIDLGFSHPKPN